MADIIPVVSVGRRLIQSYGDGRFRIGGVVYVGSVIVLPEGVTAWPVASAEAISGASLAAVAEAVSRPEILLLGCGPRLVLVVPELRRAFKELGIVVEPMDTGAACRTFNVMVAEDRRVAAALIAV
ncbi:MAG: Mth938-like domain-containing protein [Alphaproteobacteria bacterium]|nr:Mth938-like domain-containing protein [Alphaproteobacteria bacterium]